MIIDDLIIRLKPQYAGRARNPAALTITRRPPPPPPEQFICAVCEEPNPKPKAWAGEFHEDKPPICDRCVQIWGWGYRLCRPRLKGGTYADQNQYLRLRAVTEAFNWEIHNGGGRARF